MPSLPEATSRSIEWVRNGGKKKLGAHGATSAATVAIIIATMQMYPSAVPGYSAGQLIQAKVDTLIPDVATLTEGMATLKDGQADLAAESRATAQSVARIEGLLAGMAANPGKRVELKQDRDTVISYFDIERGSGIKSFWRRGPTTDTLMIPVVGDST